MRILFSDLKGNGRAWYLNLQPSSNKQLYIVEKWTNYGNTDVKHVNSEKIPIIKVKYFLGYLVFTILFGR